MSGLLITSHQYTPHFVPNTQLSQPPTPNSLLSQIFMYNLFPHHNVKNGEAKGRNIKNVAIRNLVFQGGWIIEVLGFILLGFSVSIAKSIWMATAKGRGNFPMWVVGIIVLLVDTERFVEAMKPSFPPILPKQYQGKGNVLQALLNASWPAAQGPTSTYTFFAPQNSAVKVLVLKPSSFSPLFCIVVVILHMTTSRYI